MNPGRWGVNWGCVLALGFALTTLARASVVHAQESPGEGYLVLPFENKKGTAEMDPYSGALAQALAERLEAHPQLRPAYGPQVLPAESPPISDQQAAQLARAAGARWVIGGTVDRDDSWKLVVEERLLWVDGDNVRELARVSGKSDKDDVQVLVATVAMELLAKGARPVPPEAQAAIKRRLTKDPYAFYLYGKAIAHIHGYGKFSKNPEKAREMLDKMVRIEPRFAEGHRLRGWFFLEQGKPQKARGEYSYALELRRDYFLPLVGLARMYRAGGGRAHALDHVRRALEIRPGDVESRYLYGQLLYEDGKLDDAYGELKKVVATAPRHLGARRALVLIHAARGAGEELAQELEGIVALEPGDLDARLDLGSAYQRLGELDKAIAAYQAVLERKPRHLAATKFLADLYRARGDYDRAVDLYKVVMKLAPRDPRPYFLLGATYVQLGRDAKAESVFREAQQFKRYQPEAWNNLGAISYRRGDISRAVAYLERAVQKLPRRPKVHYNLGLALSAAKQRERAEGELRTVATLDPDDAEIRYALGVVLLREGRLDAAAKEFREAVTRRADHQDALHNLALIEELARRTGENEIISPALQGTDKAQSPPPPPPNDRRPPPPPPRMFGPEPPPGFRPPP